MNKDDQELDRLYRLLDEADAHMQLAKYKLKLLEHDLAQAKKRWCKTDG
jgi:hypothetical protein